MIQQYQHYQHPPHRHRFTYSSRGGSGGGGRSGSNDGYGSTVKGDDSFSGSNRSRSDTGSSTESSKGSRGGHGSNNGNPRRRSHRPRGCRGGANKRKHILRQQQQQQQQMSLQKRQQELQQQDHHTAQLNRDTNIYHGIPPQSNHQRGSNSHDFSYQLITSNSCKMDAAGSGAREGSNGLYMDDYHHCRGSQERKETTVDRRDPSGYHGPGYYHGSNSSVEHQHYDAFSPHLSFVSQIDGTRFTDAISMNENSTNASIMGGAFILQRSYSDTSSSVSDGGESFQSNNRQKDYLYGDDASLFPAAPSTSRPEDSIDRTCEDFNILPNGHLVNDQILPPLPSGAFTKQRTIPSGPNPYALTRFPFRSHQTDTGLFAEEKNRLSTDRVLQPRQSNINNLELKFESSMDKPSLACISHGALESLDSQQNLLIQNQVMVENCGGGSLFVTSPRSFLMGAASKNGCTASFTAPKKVLAAERIQPSK